MTTTPGERRMDDNWHLDKKVPLSLIFAMLVQAAMVVWAVADIKKDVEILKTQVSTQHDRDERQDKAATETYQRLSNQLEKIDLKLDRLVEKRIEGFRK
jgi:predicted Holliday junction resolvase-like endonuclease